jgi:hypothetical protein
MVDKKVRAMFIFEALGRPAEYLEKALKEHILKLENIKTISIENQKFHPPKK